MEIGRALAEFHFRDEFRKHPREPSEIWTRGLELQWLLEQLDVIRKTARVDVVRTANDGALLEAVRVEYLGRKGRIQATVKAAPNVRHSAAKQAVEDTTNEIETLLAHARTLIPVAGESADQINKRIEKALHDTGTWTLPPGVMEPVPTEQRPVPSGSACLGRAQTHQKTPPTGVELLELFIERLQDVLIHAKEGERLRAQGESGPSIAAWKEARQRLLIETRAGPLAELEEKMNVEANSVVVRLPE